MKTLVVGLFLSTTLLLSAQQRRDRGPDKAPKLGEAIPTVSATSLDGKKTVDFSKPKRVTILIFGSHT